MPENKFHLKALRIKFIPTIFLVIHKNKYPIISFLISLTFLVNTVMQAQEIPKEMQNLRRYDYDWLHFGFALGINSTNFIVSPVKDFQKLDSLKVLGSKPEAGFNLAIVSEVALTKYIKLRFVPDLSFAERDLDYHFVGSETITWVKKVESTFLDFPLDIKYKSKRVNNFGMYLLGGGKYVIDLASQKDVNNANLDAADQVIKLRKNDFAYSLGAGIDMYAPYFKFSIDVKLSIGLKDLLINDNTVFSNPIEKLNSKVVLISFNFEG